MTRNGVWSLAVATLASAWMISTAGADATPPMIDRYQSIIDRNPFGLRPPKLETKAEEPPAPPPPKVEIKLTGITTLLTPKKAFLMTKDDEGEIKYYGLAENQKQDGIEVIRIDENKREVEIKNSGAQTLLTFKTHGITNLASLPNPKSSSRIELAGGRLPPGVTPPRTVPGALNRSGRTGSPIAIPLPARTVRAGSSPNVSTARPTFRRSTSQPLRSTDMPAQVYSAEEQVLMLEIQKAANPDIEFPPTPPLPGTQPFGGDQEIPAPPALPGQ